MQQQVIENIGHLFNNAPASDKTMLVPNGLWKLNLATPQQSAAVITKEQLQQGLVSCL